MPTDAPTPSGAMLVWVPTGPDDIGDVKATTPFFGMYRLYEQADGKWYAYLLGHAGSLLIAGGSNVGFRDEAAARAACEADCRERMRAAGWVPAGQSARLREALADHATKFDVIGAYVETGCGQQLSHAKIYEWASKARALAAPAPSVATVSADAIREVLDFCDASAAAAREEAAEGEQGDPYTYNEVLEAEAAAYEIVAGRLGTILPKPAPQEEIKF